MSGSDFLAIYIYDHISSCIIRSSVCVRMKRLVIINYIPFRSMTVGIEMKKRKGPDRF